VEEHHHWQFLSVGDWLLDPRSLGVGFQQWEEDPEMGCCGITAYTRPNLHCACGVALGRVWNDCSAQYHAHLDRDAVVPVRCPEAPHEVRVIGEIPILSRADLQAELGSIRLDEDGPAIVWLNADVSSHEMGEAAFNEAWCGLPEAACFLRTW
jgi:hypothetical protein